MSYKMFMVILASLLAQLCSAANCYLPNGAEMNSTVTYQCPTNGDLKGSMCCRSMDPSGASGADKCVKVGDQDGSWLCQNDDGSLWRRGCSDQSWDSNGCVNICRNSTADANGVIFAAADEPITACSDGSYCCADATGGASCCDNGQNFFIVNGAESKQKPASSSSIAGAAATVTVTKSSGSTGSSSSSSASSSSSSSSSTHTSAGAIAGSVIGGFVGGALLMAAISFFLFFSHKRKQHRQKSGVVEIAGNEYGPYDDRNFAERSAEAKIASQPSEIGGAPRRHELGS